MRTSGRGGSETFMFIAPAAIFGGLFVWLYGSPFDLLVGLDRAVLRAANTALAWLGTLLS